MTNSSENPIPAHFGQAVINNLIDYLLLVRKSSFAERRDTLAYSGWHTRIAHPWYNGVVVTRSPDESAPQVVRETLDYFQSRDVGAFSWWCRPPLDHASWEPVLSPFGFRLDDATPGMAVDLGRLDRSHKGPPNLQIRLVDDLHLLAEWVRIFLSGYELPSSWEGDFYSLLSDLPLDWPVRYYLGYQDGIPVATSNAFLSGGIVGVYCVATLPEARGRGLGGALTVAPLVDAEKQGCNLGILQSSRMGFSVYRQLGFQTVCQITHFVGSAGLE